MIVEGAWQPGIGDPTLLGWATVAAYAAAALAAWRAQRQSQAASVRRFWFGLAMAMLLLGLNKQLDLQSALTELGRQLAWQGGWYGERQPVQLGFIAALVFGALASLAGLSAWARPWTAARLLGLGGAVGLAAFVLIRASSFHRVDAVLGSSAWGLRWNHWIELGGIALVATGALLERRRAVA